MLEKDLDIDAFQYNLINAAYFLPNWFVPILGGYLIDTIGIRPVLIGTSTLLLIG